MVSEDVELLAGRANKTWPIVNSELSRQSRTTKTWIEMS